MAGWVLEVLVGHATFFGLVWREVLCVFSTVYRFIKKHYGTLASMWPSVRDELRVLRDFMVLVKSSWALP